MEILYPQSFYSSAGKYGCYALCIIRAAARIRNVPMTLTFVSQALEIGIDRKYISFNGSNYSDVNNFYVFAPDAFLGALTGNRYTVRVEGAKYKPDASEVVIDFMALSEKDGRNGKGHFVISDIGFDPLGNSRTREQGIVYSKRVFRKAV